MNIYVGNLPLDVTEEQLRQQFVVFGEVLAITVMNNKYIGSGQSKGYAYIEMTSKSNAENAIASLNGSRFMGQTLDIVAALPLSDKKGEGHFPPKRAQRPYGKTRKRIS